MSEISDPAGPAVATALPAAETETRAPCQVKDHGDDAGDDDALPAPRRSRRLLLFAVLCGVCLLVAGGYTAWAARQSGARQTVTAGSAADRAAIAAGPHLLFAEAGDNPLSDDPLAMATLAGPDAARYHPGFTCQRVYFAAGEGLCLTLGHAPAPGLAFIFDADFHVLHTVPASGIPSRARISPDGRYGSMTFFVAGDSYTADGQFSTRTSIVDMKTGAVLANLEDFIVRKDGQVFRQTDFNFWGVTFAQDSNRFYATLGTSGTTYLVQGDLAARTLQTLAENVECPSLSPDNRHIVFKKRVADGPPPIWRLSVLDLASMQQKPLAETRSVDDQAEWLDNNHVLYTPAGQHPGVWAVPADGSGQPKLFVAGAVSPAVVH